MSIDSSQPAMSQQIFKIGLPVEAVSVYLLCCGLSDAGAPITLSSLMPVWNGTPDQLQDNLRLLCDKKILSVTQEPGPSYRINADSLWSV